MSKRRDLPRRRPYAIELREEHDESADTFAVVAYVGTEHGGKVRVDTTGGFIRGWSTFTSEVQDIVRADLHAIAEREARTQRS